MKNLLCPAVLIVQLVVTSCSKDEGSGTKPAMDLSKCRISRVQVNESNYTEYTYSESGRIVSIREVVNGDEAVYPFEYVGTTQVKVSANGRPIMKFTLNGDGNATQKQQFFYAEPDSTSIAITETEDYTYNADGYLTSVKKTYGAQGAISTELTTNTWTDGNLTSKKVLTSTGGISIDTYTYFTDKDNSFAFTLQHRNFNGKQCKNLLKSHDGYIDYTYKFDNPGRVTKEIFGGIVRTYSWD